MTLPRHREGCHRTLPRGVDGDHAVAPRDLKGRHHLLVRAHDRQRPAAGRVELLGGAGDDPDRGRVDERHVGEVEYQAAATRLNGPHHPRLELRADLEVDLAPHDQNGEILAPVRYLYLIADVESPHSGASTDN